MQAGTAGGRGHTASADPTRAGGGAGREPGKGRGELSGNAPYGRKFATGASAPVHRGFDAATTAAFEWAPPAGEVLGFCVTFLDVGDLVISGWDHTGADGFELGAARDRHAVDIRGAVTAATFTYASISVTGVQTYRSGGM